MNIFINHDEQRLRAGWRMLAQLFVMYFIGFGLILILHLTMHSVSSRLSIIMMAIGAVLSTLMAARGLDRRPWKDYGITFSKKSYYHCLLGFLLSGIAMGIIYVIEYIAGWLTFANFGWTGYAHPLQYIAALITYFLFMVVVGFYEELVFRGYQIVNLSEGLNLQRISRRQAAIIAVALSSLIFGMLHAFNPDAGIISTIYVTLAGAMLAFPFIITGRLSLSIGLHIGWNFFEGGIFGFTVSGMPTRTSLLHIHQQGPTFITGGAFGPEAGLMGLLGIALIVSVLWWRFRKYKQPLAISDRIGIYSSSPRYPHI